MLRGIEGVAAAARRGGHGGARLRRQALRPRLLRARVLLHAADLCLELLIAVL
jgi:hypothetical protein